jgi:hypothetical protein
MALRDWLFHSERVATGVCSPPCPGVAEVATVAVATPRKSKTDGAYEAVTALENANTVGNPVPVAKVAAVAIATARNSKGEERDIDELVHDSLCVSEHLATATAATSATPCFVERRAVAKTKDSKTGELVPRLLAMAEPVPGDEFQARRSCGLAGSKQKETTARPCAGRA